MGLAKRKSLRKATLKSGDGQGTGGRRSETPVGSASGIGFRAGRQAASKVLHRHTRPPGGRCSGGNRAPHKDKRDFVKHEKHHHAVFFPSHWWCFDRCFGVWLGWSGEGRGVGSGIAVRARTRVGGIRGLNGQRRDLLQGHAVHAGVYQPDSAKNRSLQKNSLGLFQNPVSTLKWRCGSQKEVQPCNGSDAAWIPLGRCSASSTAAPG